MSPKTVVLPGTAIVAHVPVDQFEIVIGPGTFRSMQAQSELQQHLHDLEPYYVDLDFTLKTPASETTFRRTLKVASIFNVIASHGTFEFTAIFSGRIVSGVYSMKDHTGWFNLD